MKISSDDLESDKKLELSDRFTIVALSFVSIVLLIFLHGFIIAHLWNWYIAPITDILPRINNIQGVGVSFFVTAFKDIKSKNIDNNYTPITILIEQVVNSLIFLGIAWLFHIVL